MIRGAESGAPKNVIIVWPDVDVTDARVERARFARHIGNDGSIWRGEMCENAAIGFDGTKIAADDNAVAVFFHDGAQFRVTVRFRAKHQVNHDGFCAGVGKLLNERGPNAARPRKTSAQFAEHGIVRHVVGKNHVVVARPVNADKDEVGIGGREATGARKKILEIIIRILERRVQQFRAKNIHRQHGERDECAKARDDGGTAQIRAAGIFCGHRV